MARLCWAQLLVRWIRFEQWRDTLGLNVGHGERTADPEMAAARGLAADVEWAAKRLPFATKCLPRAMALSWMLRRLRIAHSVVIAVRPDQDRRSPDALHAWVEVGGERVTGDLPGPWIETARFSS